MIKVSSLSTSFVIAGLLLVGAPAEARPAAPQVLILRHVSLIGRPLDDVWTLLGDFGGMARWFGVGTQGRLEGDLGVGLTRVLTTPEGRVNRELLLEYSRERHLIKYTLTNVGDWPRPYTTYATTVRAEAAGPAATRVTWTMEVTPKDAASEKPTADFLALAHRRIMEDAAKALGASIKIEE